MPEASIQQVVASNPDFNPGRNVSEMDAKPRSGQSFENRIEQPSRKRPLSSSFSTGSHSAGGASSRKRHKALPQENEDSHKALAKDYGSLPSLKNLAESSGLPPAEVLRLLKSQLNSAAAASQDPVLPVRGKHQKQSDSAVSTLVPVADLATQTRNGPSVS